MQLSPSANNIKIDTTLIIYLRWYETKALFGAITLGLLVVALSG